MMMTVNLVALLVGAVFIHTTVAEGTTCYDGWVRHGSSCYGFGEEYVSWAGASSLCQIFDGNLAEIETAEENEFLKNYSRTKSYESLWVGGTDIFTEGHWLWSGSKLSLDDGFTDWAPNEPNHSGGYTNEDCLQLYGALGYQWNDEDCEHANPFVCEVPLEG